MFFKENEFNLIKNISIGIKARAVEEDRRNDIEPYDPKNR